MGKFIKKISNNNSGFTIIELIIYTVLVAIVVTIFSTFLVDVLKNSMKIVAIKEVNQKSRFIISRINQEIKTANQIDAIVDPKKLSFENKDGNTVNFYLNTVDGIIYFDDDNNSLTPDLKISNNTVLVTALVFTKIGNGVKIEVTIESKKFPSSTGTYKNETTSLVIPRSELYK